MSSTPDPQGPSEPKPDASAKTLMPDHSTGSDAPAGAVTRAPTNPGRYVPLGTLGSGGMGVVWLAWDTELHRSVALKRLRCDEAGTAPRILREARLAAKLRHPHILPVHDVGELDGSPFFTMEYVDGRTMTDYLDETRAERRRGSRPDRERLRQEVTVLAQVARAVAYAHEHGVIHRDVKPENVLLDRQGHPHVMDFGLAKELGGSRLPTALATATGQVVGTPAYMSPEQAAGEIEKVGAPADVWALGAMLYEVLTGVTPFDAGEGPWAIVASVIEDDSVPPRVRNRYAPADLEAVCVRALEKDLSARMGSAAEFAEDLERWLRGEPVRSRARGWMRRAARWLARRRIIAAAVLILVLASGWTVHGTWNRHRREERLLEEMRDIVLRYEHEVKSTAMANEARRGLAEQSRRVLEEMVAANPDLGPVYSYRGYLCELMGERTEADRDLDLGCKLASSDAVAFYLRGTVAIGRYAEARGLPTTIVWGARVEFEAQPPEAARESEGRARGLRDLSRMVELLEADSPIGREEERLGRAMVAIYGKRLADSASRSGDGRELNLPLELLAGLESPKAQKLRGIVRYLRSEFAEAAEEFGRALAAWPEDVVAWVARGDALSALGAVREGSGLDGREVLRRAVADHGEALRRDPDWWDAYLGRGFAGRSLGLAEAVRGGDPRPRFAQAVADLGEAIRRHPERGTARNLRGLAYRGLGDAETARGIDPRRSYRWAIDDFDAAIRSDPAQDNAYNNRGNVWRRLGEAEAAGGDDPERSYARALADFDLILGRIPDVAEPWCNRGLTWWRFAEAEARRKADPRESCGKALADLGEALRRDPALGEAWINQGNVRRLVGEAEAARGEDPRPSYGKAIADYDEALRHNPAIATAYQNRGLAWSHMGDAEAEVGVDPRGSYARSIIDLGEALRRNPGGVTVYRSRAMVHRRTGRAAAARGEDPRKSYRSAVADLDEALRRNPTDPSAWHDRADAVADLGQAEEARGADPRGSCRRALADYAEALRRDPRRTTAWRNRGAVGLHLGEMEAARGEDPTRTLARAAADLGEGLSRNPGSGDLLHLRAIVLTHQGEAEAARGADPGESRRRAEEDFRGAIERGFPMARLSLGRFLSDIGRFEEAIAACQEVARDLPEQAARARATIASAHFGLACRHARAATAAASRSERDRAFEHLGAAIECGWDDRGRAQVEADLAPLREDSRWAALWEVEPR